MHIVPRETCLFLIVYYYAYSTGGKTCLFFIVYYYAYLKRLKITGKISKTSLFSNASDMNKNNGIVTFVINTHSPEIVSQTNLFQ